MSPIFLLRISALISLSGWPVLKPGVFGSHELFHFFVIAGSACHAQFMLRVVVPARQPANWNDPVDCRHHRRNRFPHGWLAEVSGIRPSWAAHCSGACIWHPARSGALCPRQDPSSPG